MDISVSIASIFNAVSNAVFVSRFAVTPLPVLREEALDEWDELEEPEDAGDGAEGEVLPEEPGMRFVREASLSAGLAGWRSFFPKSEKIPKISLPGKRCCPQPGRLEENYKCVKVTHPHAELSRGSGR
ncbi:hypothetical protein [Noviherbaspirillum aerium]|uniref:hypothetical protein n=1 Tax=Noviherbaspirillum aerium TaxID=2588497 RepID=UPI001CEFA5A4|nr:hypothetical protein [Noviherbaspirillum aerium]